MFAKPLSEERSATSGFGQFVVQQKATAENENTE